jgi:hypothetical protein
VRISAARTGLLLLFAVSSSQTLAADEPASLTFNTTTDAPLSLSITEMFSPIAPVRALIRDASQVREPRRHSQLDLSEQTLGNLLDYLWHMRKRTLDNE